MFTAETQRHGERRQGSGFKKKNMETHRNMEYRIGQYAAIARAQTRRSAQRKRPAETRRMAVLFAILAVRLHAGTDVLANRVTDEEALLRSYFRFQIVQEIPRQTDGLIANLPSEVASEAREAVANWTSLRMAAIRDALFARFGEEARARLELFVSDFTVAENRSDKAFLNKLCKGAGMGDPIPADYAGFRAALLSLWFKADLQAAAKLLSDVQTWLDMRGQVKDLPRLRDWLVRDESSLPVQAVVAPVENVPALAAAEPTVDHSVADRGGEDASGALDVFSKLRKSKQERVLQEAQLGMQQVASERQMAEQEYAAKKLAAAQAEAEAIKRQAQSLAAVEKSALEQRQNSWGAKIKSVVGATITAASGAFSGGVGTRAGEEAVKAIFQ